MYIVSNSIKPNSYKDNIQEAKLIEIEVKNCSRPSMRNTHGGRTWDTIGQMWYKSKKVEMRADTTWGMKAYFSLNDKWYSIDLKDVERLDNRIIELKRGSIK